MNIFNKLNDAAKPVLFGLSLIVGHAAFPDESKAQTPKPCAKVDFTEPCFTQDNLLRTARSYEDPTNPRYGAFNLQVSGGHNTPSN